MWGVVKRIEPLKCRFEKIFRILGLWLQGSHLDEVDAEFCFPFACCGLHERKFFGANLAEFASFHS